MAEFNPGDIPKLVAESIGSIAGASDLGSDTIEYIIRKVIQTFPNGGDTSPVRQAIDTLIRAGIQGIITSEDIVSAARGWFGFGATAPGDPDGRVFMPTNGKLCLDGAPCTKYLTYDGVNVLINGSPVGGGMPFGVVEPAYGAVVTCDPSLGNEFSVHVTDGNGFSMIFLDGVAGQIIEVRIRNEFGVMGAINWDSNMLMQDVVWVNPAAGKNRAIQFVYDSVSVSQNNWYEITRSVGDVPNSVGV